MDHQTTPTQPAPAGDQTGTLDPQRYYTLDELFQMPQEDLEELWSACPDPEFYQDAFERQLHRQYGADTLISDAQRLATLDQLIEWASRDRPIHPFEYSQGNKLTWATPPLRVRQLLEQGIPLTARPAPPVKSSALPQPLLLAGAAALLLCLLGIIVNKAVIQPHARADSLTATAQALLPPTTTTPTPLALENIDRPIGAGDALRNRFPLILEIRHGQDAALVFPVQQKGVQIAEWDYDRDPDVASSVLGLAIRPVLGIPFTPSHLSYLSALAPGDPIRLQMNTGQSLTFAVKRAGRVARQNTALFDQSAPGIVLALVGDPGPDRMVVYGSYVEPAGAPSPTAGSTLVQPHVAQPFGDGGLSIALESAYLSSGSADAPLPPDWSYLLIDLKLSAAAPVSTANLVFQLADMATGATYNAARVSPSIADQPPFAPGMMQAGQTQTATIGFLVPRSLATPQLAVQASPDTPAAAYAVPLGSLYPASPTDLQVVLLKTETTGTSRKPGELVITARLYNPTGQTITLDARNLSVVYTPALADKQFPIGPANPPSAPSLPLAVPASQSVDAEIHFPWSGDGYAGLTLGGYQYILTLAQAGRP